MRKRRKFASKKSRGDGLIWKYSKCKFNLKKLCHYSIFFNIKWSSCILLLIQFHFTINSRFKIIKSLEVDAKTVTDWCKYFRYGMARILQKLEIKLRGPVKNSKGDGINFLKYLKITVVDMVVQMLPLNKIVKLHCECATLVF